MGNKIKRDTEKKIVSQRLKGLKRKPFKSSRSFMALNYELTNYMS